MRLPGAREVPGAALWFGFLGGPLVLPGAYKVRLTAGREVLTKPFDILKDPRLAITDRDLREQFEFLLGVRDTLSGVSGAVLTARAIRDQITEWVSRAEGLPGADALTGAARELSAELDRIEDELIQGRAEAYEDVFHYPVRLNNQIATIADLMNMADTAPTRQARELFDELRGRADRQIARLNEIKKGGVSMFSDALVKLGVPPIRIPADE
jgi:NifU-like protein involved in Fe-S cluster formation